MDAINQLVGNTEAFPILKEWDFFNHAGVAPLPHVAAEALRQYSTQAETAAYMASGWHRNLEIFRQDAAKMLNAHRDEIAFVKNTSEGISIVASGIDWQWGERVVTTGVEYPANIYPWMEAARSSGIKLIMVPEEDGPGGCRHVPIEKILEAASVPNTRLVTLSHVEFASGQRHDLKRIGEFFAERNILFCVDGIQSVGVLPVDVEAMHIDFLSADGHKWMLGPEGAGIFYCRRKWLEHIRPLTIGWMNVVNAQNFGVYDYTLRPDAGRFESGSYNVPGLLAFKASVDLLQSAGIPQISQRLKKITDLFIAAVTAKGYRVISPRSDDQWSGIVSFVSPTHKHDLIFEALRNQHRTEIAVREHRLRCSPHFYNTEEQLQRLADRLPPN